MAIEVVNTEELLARNVPGDTTLDGWPVVAAPVERAAAEEAEGLRTHLLRDGAAMVSFPDRLSDHEMTVATWNLLTLLARPVSQYETGELIYPVEVRPGGDGASHYSATTASGGLHTDGSLLPKPPDVALLVCLAAADAGGETILVDTDAVYGHLEQTAPELVETLCRPQPFLAPDRRTGGPQWAPVLRFADDGAVRMRYLRRYLESGWLSAAGAVPLELTAAMDAIDHFTMAEENQTAYLLRRGEALLWRNERYIHGRRAFTEHSSARRLVRMYAGDEAETSDDGR